MIDLNHLGRDRVIGTWEHDGVLIDPGPESTLDTLVAGLGDGFEPRAVLLTHIHFDHAGATGALLERWPDVPVFVHERGAKHLVDPERLVASARRLYGDDFDRLWGEVVPVPEGSLTVLQGGETVLDDYHVEYTPGHASHHVSYLHEPTGTAFVGDVAGVRIAPSELVVAPTPPPDVDVAAWEASLDLVAGWAPERLALTHFGAGLADVGAHLEACRAALLEEAELVGRTELDAFIAAERDLITQRADVDTFQSYAQAVPFHHIWLGLHRWHSKQETA